MKSIVILSIFCFLSVVAGGRFKRQINPNFGFPQPNFAFPQINFPSIQPGAPGTQTSFTSQTLNSRFGEDSQPVVTGQSTHFSSTGNQFSQTNTYLRPDGTVTSNKQSGRVRRQSPTEKEPIKESDKPDYDTFKQQQHQQQGAPQPPVTPKQNFQPQPNYQQQQPIYQQQQPNYQPVPPNQFPFGIGFFGQPQFGFQQNPFGNPFAPIGFPQPVPINPIPQGIPQQGIPAQGNFIGASQTLDNRFGEEEGVVTSGGSQFITSQNGNYQITSSVLKPNGQVVTSQQSGTINKKP